MSQPELTLTPAQADALGRELDAIRTRELADLGKRDADYIRRIVRVQRTLEVGGRVLMFAGVRRPAWLGGVAMLAASKILDNWEIGHNVMHGQYDWMGDPALHGPTFEWDSACPSDHWRYAHNYLHHTYTNIIGLDRDIGYAVLRVKKDQPWDRLKLLNPINALLGFVLFQYSLAGYELEIERMPHEITMTDKREALGVIVRKVFRQVLKDFVAFPLLAGRSRRFVLTGNLAANLIRNMWTFAITFCGHFPDGARVFTIEEARDESRGMWYYRQILGTANMNGGKLFHILSGNLSHQIEHHLFPDLPAHRYAELAPEVREICRRYGIPYNTGSLPRQLGTVLLNIFRLAFP
ncbi:fatty acid desaturase [Mycobacterium sp. pW045]|uniref:fatty acid desaturase family protein n=1 Tax=Mycobacterium sp. pW045 TaxID=3238984 RepID=UPI00351B38BC